MTLLGWALGWAVAWAGLSWAGLSWAGLSHAADMTLPIIQAHVPGGLQGQGSGLAAEWAEELCLDVSPEGLAAADALLLLEVLQLPSGFARFKVCAPADGYVL